MCVVSMITDHYFDKWKRENDINKNSSPFTMPISPIQPFTVPDATYLPVPAISMDEIAEFRKLLERAREYDKRNNEPDCELQEKKDQLLKLAEQLGIKIDFL